ncbi:SRPBCC domain-containing protein [Humidisolicoccus flavus]|uniref:SRPBCC domain-containing protein n=1 Tax=Humidisolicoccus flavus TaxID=3111414 RepID=UPI003248538D
MTRVFSLEAPIDVVWRALTEPEHQARWLGDIAAFPDGVSVGAQGRFAWSGEVVLAARILAYEEQRAFAFEWAEGFMSEKATRVSFRLRPDHGGVLLHFEESGFAIDGDESAVRNALRALAQGWTVELDEFNAYVHKLVSHQKQAAS